MSLLPVGTTAKPCGPAGALHTSVDGGFALHEAFLWRVAGVSGPRVVQFPPSGGSSPRLEAVWPPNCRPIE